MTINEAYERLGRVVHYTWMGLGNEADQTATWERINGTINLFDYLEHYGAFEKESPEKDVRIK